MIVIMEEKEEKPKSNRGLILAIIIMTPIFIALIVGIVNPLLYIEKIWDWDIQQQLEDAEKNVPEDSEIKMRFTYKNNPESEIRVQRAIGIFLNTMYDPQDPEHNYTMMKTDEQIIVQFTWIKGRN